MTRFVCAVSLAVSLCAHAGGAADAGVPPPELKLMAFNVLFKGANDAKSLDAIEAENADVVCLTELTPTFVKALESSPTLAKRYPYRSFAPQKGTWGVGFASKVPLANVQTGPVPPVKIPAMEATVQFDGGPVQLLCVHLIPPGGKDGVTLDTLSKNATTRKKQAETMVARYAKVKTAVVLLGDFNEEPVGAAMHELDDAGWRRGCLLPTSSCGATFPGPVFSWPAVFQVDHVLARGLTFLSAKTVRAGGSDHYPVVATLKR
ncbi:MAG: endonuclease/exonuclease/phosphatase family protein [Archangium sp.]